MPVDKHLQRHWETVSLAKRNTLMEINHISVSSQMQQASWLKCQNTYTVLQAAFSQHKRANSPLWKDYFCLWGQRWSEHSKIHKNAHLNFLSSVSAHYFLSSFLHLVVFEMVGKRPHSFLPAFLSNPKPAHLCSYWEWLRACQAQKCANTSDCMQKTRQ